MKNEKFDFLQMKDKNSELNQLKTQNVENDVTREPSFTTTTITVEDQKIIDKFQSENMFLNSKQIQFIQENQFYFPQNFAYPNLLQSPLAQMSPNEF